MHSCYAVQMLVMECLYTLLMGHHTCVVYVDWCCPCRFKAHSPVLSLAWMRNSKGFIFGCKSGMLALVDITDVRGSVGYSDIAFAD